MTRPNLYLIQLAWIVVGFIAALVTTFLQTRTFYYLSYVAYILVNVLLVAVLFIGVTAKGGQRWIDIGFMNLQPSELAKVSVVLAMARFCADYPVIGGYNLRMLLRPFNLTRPLALMGVVTFVLTSTKLLEKAPELTNFISWQKPWVLLTIVLVLLVWFFFSALQLSKEGLHMGQFIAPIDVVLLPFLLIAVEPDLATAMIVMAIAGTMILFCGVRPLSFFITVLAFALVSVVAWNFALKDYQKKRVETFLNPEIDIHGQGYHAAQSLIAIGSGQIFGKGPGNGTQTQLSFLPENHTDFAFAVLAEEWGFVGSFILIFLYMILISLMIGVAIRASDRFSVLLCIGSASMLFWHVFINIGMVTGLLPVAGVPLPLMSYGGSSMLTQMTAIAICFNVAVWRKVK